MRLAFLLGIALPSIRGATLTYPDNIDLFEFSWTNPDQTGLAADTGPADGTLMTDGVTTVGSGEILSNVGLWGDLSTDTTVGMDGTFQATTINVDSGYSYWSITTAEVVFDSGGCFSSDTTASAFYFDRTTATTETLTVTATDSNDIYTFSADIATSIASNGYIGFHVTSNVGCEGEIAILEFVLEGEQIATAEPTEMPTSAMPTAEPTSKPTAAPTPEPSAAPTAAPTAEPTSVTTLEPTPAPETTTTATTTSEDCGVDDFRLSIQLAQGQCKKKKSMLTTSTNNEGEIRSTPYLQSAAGDWSVWAGTSGYKNPAAFRIGIFADDPDFDGFCLKDTDIRFGIQLTDCANDQTGNAAHDGPVEYTQWASEGGGWSDFAGDSDARDFEAVRVVIESKDSPGLVITDIMAGAWLSDSGCRNSHKAGDPVYSNWLSWDGGDWSLWGSDNNWHGPDAVAIYLGVISNYGDTVNAAAAFTAVYDGSDGDGASLSAGAVAAVVCGALLCCMAMAFVWHRRRRKVIAVGVPDDDEIGTLGADAAANGRYDMTPVAANNANAGAEDEVMIEVEVTATNH